MTTIDERVASAKARLDALRPLSGPGLAALSSWYDVELTYTSNAIEGNTLTRGETALVVEKGITIGGKPLRDHLEAVGHWDALEYARSLARQDRPVRETDIRQIHALVIGRIDPAEAGRHVGHQRLISGTALLPPAPAQVVPMMGDLGQWFGAAPATAGTAIAAHERLVSIHPFADGNGRTARLLMNLLLLRGGYPPVVIGPEHRVAYIDALEAFQVGGDPGPYRLFMTDRLQDSLDHHLMILGR